MKIYDFFNKIRQGDIDSVKKELINSPDLISEKDERGSSPLILSCYLNKANIARLLIEFGSNVNELDSMGNSALIGVSFKGNLEIVKILVDNKAKLDIQNNS